MAEGCRICQRADVHTINAALVHGEPLRALARRYAIPKTSLVRHARHVAQRTEKETTMTTTTAARTLEPDVALDVAQLHAQLGEVRSQLARTQAQLSGINREFTAWRAEQTAQCARCDADHALLAQLQACLQVLQTDDTAWRVLESILRGDGHNGRGPLLQALRRLVGRKVLTLVDH
jgi:hypothetical protein